MNTRAKLRAAATMLVAMATGAGLFWFSTRQAQSGAGHGAASPPPALVASERARGAAVPASDEPRVPTGPIAEEAAEVAAAPTSAPEPRSTEIEAPAPELPGGLTEAHRESLLGIQAQFRAATGFSRTNLAFHYAGRSVATILRARGLADFGTPDERERGFSSRPSYPGEMVFVSDGARFRFDRGQFPAYDRAHDLLDAAMDLDGTRQGKAKPEELPEELVDELDRLAEEALRVFESAK